jgi:hypothetical protein
MRYRYQRKETALPSTHYNIVLHSTSNVYLFVAYNSGSNQLLMFYKISTGFYNGESLLPRSSLSRDIVIYRRFRTTIRSHLQGSSRPRRISQKMRLIGCLETSVTNYQPALRKNQDERRSHSHRGESP